MTTRITTDYRGTQHGIDRLIKGLDNGARQFVSESTAYVTAEAQANANTGAHPKGQGHIPGTGPGPNVVTGTNRRSIKPTPTRRVVEGWSGTAGPTTGYSRRLELGGGGWSSGVKFPFLGPAISKWKRQAREQITRILGGELR